MCYFLEGNKSNFWLLCSSVLFRKTGGGREWVRRPPLSCVHWIGRGHSKVPSTNILLSALLSSKDEKCSQNTFHLALNLHLALSLHLVLYLRVNNLLVLKRHSRYLTNANAHRTVIFNYVEGKEIFITKRRNVEQKDVENKTRKEDGDAYPGPPIHAVLRMKCQETFINMLWQSIAPVPINQTSNLPLNNFK